MKTADSQIYLWIDGESQILKIAKICVIWVQKNDSLSNNFNEDRRLADLFLRIDCGIQIYKILKISIIRVIVVQKKYDSLSTNFKEDRRFADSFKY